MYFIYKSLAHPELAGNYVQPFTLDERLAHARQAEKQLGATVPWLVDAMDNRLKHALGDRANSEFIIDPKGIIVRKRAWSHPAQVRKDLEQLVGPVENVTKEEDVKLKLELPIKSAAVRGALPRLKRPEQMQAIVIEPKIDPKGSPFFAKLRAETDNELFREGTGKLYLGFHLDPLHESHWNNLTKPLSFKLDVPDGMKIGKLTAEAAAVAVPSDADPREFLVDVEFWPEGKSIRLTVIYYACVGEETCHTVQQEYEVHLRRDRDAGKARGKGAGFWDPEGFARQNLARDKNGDGKLDKHEVQGLIVPHFESFDTNKDGLLDPEELKPVSDWLNYHHQPGTPPSSIEKNKPVSK
ncbi:MAG: hypothetical protein IAF94_03855 [Pirellulaceae bacterium]|nr:hypothetical protein [Pirellulaceae bacterium]